MSDLAALRGGVANASLHPESLLSIPLVRQAFGDQAFRFVERGLDASWSYERGIPVSLGGFNPFESAFYYSQSSRFAAWLSSPYGSAREFNENDLLVREVLFMVHDYLHAWAYSVIDELYPSCQVFHGAITAQTLEDYAFYHLVTEAVATVGLDYWFLCNCRLDELCPIGTNFRTLTVDYHDSQLPEYRRFSSDLQIQQPEFFRTLATFYCTGEFPGFDVSDIKRSPQLLRWLRHELSYGATQRKLARSWLAYLAAEPLALTEAALVAPLEVDTKARSRLIHDVGERLWAKVKGVDTAACSNIKPPPSPPDRRSPSDRPPDFRFVNLARVPRDDWPSLQLLGDDNFKFFVYQFLGQLPFTAVPASKRKHLPLLLQQRNVSLVLDLLGDLPLRAALPDEPRDLMVAN
jgi:hypothetical protein